MTETPNPLAPHYLPWFITAPGETDVLLVGVAIFLVGLVILLGNLYFNLHALPERWAHGTHRGQMQIVGVLALLAMFTHINLFWVAALILALVEFPDFSTPVRSIAESLRNIAGAAVRSSHRVVDRGQEPDLIGRDDKAATVDIKAALKTAEGSEGASTGREIRDAHLKPASD